MPTGLNGKENKYEKNDQAHVSFLSDLGFGCMYPYRLLRIGRTYPHRRDGRGGTAHLYFNGTYQGLALLGM